MKDGVAQILQTMHKKGVRLWSDGGRLHYEAPKGSLTSEDLASIRAHRSELSRLLEVATRTQDIAPKQVFRDRRDRAPLTFSQVSHWNLFLLAERRAMRGVTT